jgi:hypothetical protein
MEGLTPICPYCGQFSQKVSGQAIYPHRKDLFSKGFFQCAPCDAYVGTHNRTGQPLGTLANAYLRRLRNLAHAAFDPVWKEGKVDRTVAYAMLAKGTGIPFDACHIAMFNPAQCRQVIDLCNSKEIYKYASDHTPRSSD